MCPKSLFLKKSLRVFSGKKKKQKTFWFFPRGGQIFKLFQGGWGGIQKKSPFFFFPPGGQKRFMGFLFWGETFVFQGILGFGTRLARGGTPLPRLKKKTRKPGLFWLGPFFFRGGGALFFFLTTVFWVKNWARGGGKANFFFPPKTTFLKMVCLFGGQGGKKKKTQKKKAPVFFLFLGAFPPGHGRTPPVLTVILFSG